jgi:hypothetical protein
VLKDGAGKARFRGPRVEFKILDQDIRRQQLAALELFAAQAKEPAARRPTMTQWCWPS